MKTKKTLGIVGATGLVGQTAVDLLLQKKFKFEVETLKLYASESSVGKVIDFEGKKVKIEAPNLPSLKECDAVLFASNSTLSKTLIPELSNHGVFCVDKSSAFRMDPNVPLVVPEVNLGAIDPHGTGEYATIVSSPNCVVIPLVVTTHLVSKLFGLKRIIISTYQSVSGSGRAAIDILVKETKEFLTAQDLTCKESDVYPKSIAFNVFPFVESLSKDGHTGEEIKIVSEMRKILQMPELPLDVTSVRVPTFVGHAMSATFETEKQFDKMYFINELKKEKSVKISKDTDFFTPREVQGTDEIFLSRIRSSQGFQNGVSLWIAADNLRKGAALNGLQIIESLLTRNT